MTIAAGFAHLVGHRYLNLETFRRNGQAVRTPVWFAADPKTDLAGSSVKLYIYTIGTTGKAKRIRNNPRVRVAPCTARGRPLGDWADATAEIISGAEADYGMRLLNRKYLPWKQLLNFFASLRRRERIVMAIRPA